MIEFVATITVNGFSKWSIAFKDGGHIVLPPDLAEQLGKKPGLVLLHVEMRQRSRDEVRISIDEALSSLRHAEQILGLL